jgi:hypothetical protein
MLIVKQVKNNAKDTPSRISGDKTDEGSEKKHYFLFLMLTVAKPFLLSWLKSFRPRFNVPRARRAATACWAFIMS